MKMKVGALVICGLLAVAQNFTGAEQINDPGSEENIDKETAGLGSWEAGQPGDKVRDLIEEISFSENSPAGEIGDDASSETGETPEAGENSDKQSKMGSTGGGAAPKILVVKHTAQYNNVKPGAEQGLGDWVFDYPK